MSTIKAVKEKFVIDKEVARANQFPRKVKDEPRERIVEPAGEVVREVIEEKGIVDNVPTTIRKQKRKVSFGRNK